MTRVLRSAILRMLFWLSFAGIVSGAIVKNWWLGLGGVVGFVVMAGCLESDARKRGPF